MRYLYYIICLFIGVSEIKAQALAGRVIDDNKNAIPYANAQLLSHDSVFIAGAVADSLGHFSIKCASGEKYFLEISAMGYLPVHRNITPDLETRYLGDIQLHQSNITLSEVVVKAKRNPFVVKQGNFEIDVQKAGLGSQPGMADLLGFLPGIIPNGDGISFILGGNPLYILNGVEIKSFDRIKALRPDQIKNISVNNFPSAQYASTYSCIVTINTIERLSDYASAQITHTSNVGRRYNNDQSINVNLSKKKWDNYVSYNFTDNKERNSAINTYDIFGNDNHIERSNYSSNKENRHSLVHQLFEGFTYRPTEKATFNLQYYLGCNDSKFRTSTEESYTVPNEATSQNTNTMQDVKKDITQHNIDLVGDFKLNDKNTLTLSAGYLYNRSSSGNDLLANSATYNYISGKDTYDSWAFKGDYSLSLPKGYNLGMGVSYSTVKNNGLSYYLSQDKPDAPYYDDNTMLKDENAGIYINARKMFGSVFVSAGLRGELFSSDYTKNGINWYDKSTFRLFPTVTAQYMLNENFTFIGSFLSRNSNPSFRELSPLVKYINSYLYEQGNPTLKQGESYTSSMAMIFKSKFVMQARYIRNINAVIWSLNENETFANALTNSPSNLNYTTWLFNASYSDKIGIYRFAYDAALRYVPTRTKYLDGYASRQPQVKLSMVNQLVVTPRTVVSLNLAYTSKTGFLGVEDLPTYNLSFWIRQSFLKSKDLQVTLRAEDILHKSISKSYTRIGTVKANAIPDLDTRFIGVIVKYNFNGFKDIFKRKNTNEEAEQRIK